ncbi:hypothetical protein [Hymenobacter algoricola]|uniref:Uncharacterized protein n=1 Tax=Hymenobacter algoricola TaxID=486267 RepID=A0ABP7NLY9_9BACT
MAYSIDQLATKADCDRVLVPLTQKRDEAANRKSNLAFRLQTFGDPAARAAEITRLSRRISDAQADLPGMTEGREKRRVEDELSTYIKRRNQFINQNEEQGTDDRVMLEFEVATATQTHDEAVGLVGLVQVRKDSLPA